MNLFREQIWPFVLAVAVHVVLVAFLFFNVDWDTKPVRPSINADVVQAVVIDESRIKAEQEKLRKEEERRKQQERDRQKKLEDEQKKITELEKQRKEEELRVKEVEKQRTEAEQKREQEQKRAEEVKVKRQQEEREQQAKLEADKKRKADEEKKKKATEEKKRKEDEARKKKEEAERKKKEQEQRMREAQDLLEKQMEDELKSLDAATTRERARLLDVYKETVRQHVQRYWRQPPGVAPSMSCVVRVTQLPSGDVLDAKIVSCTTPDSNFQKSVVDAVLKSSPLPKPPDAALYERVIDFKFEPGK